MKTMILIFLSLFVSYVHADTPAYTYSFEHYYDKNNSYDIANIAEAPFLPTPQVLNFKNETKVHWFKVVIENTSDKREDIVIYNTKSYFNTMVYYETDAQQTLLSHSDVSKDVSYENRAFHSTLPALRFELAPQTKKTIYIKLQSNIYFISKFHVMSEDDFRQTMEKENFLYIFYFGVCFAIGIYFLVLFLINKKSLYLYYFIYTMLLAHFTYIYSGVYVYMGAHWFKYGFAIMPLTYVFLLLITQKMLKDEKKFPYFDKIILLFNTTFVLAGIIMLIDQELASKIYNVVLLFVIILATVLLVSSSKKNRIYFIAVFIYLMSLVSIPLRSLEVLPNNFITTNLMLFGSLIELFLFAVVLANHVQGLQTEQLEANAKLIALQKNQQEHLQEEVNRQTKSLNFLLKELHHRVKNNFQFISSFIWAQKQQKGSNETQQALTQINDRVFSISSLHELLSEDASSELNLQEYMQTILKSFQVNNPDIDYSYEFAQVDADYDTAISLGLILNELLTNSSKYAFENTQNPLVTVKGYEKNGLCHFTYTDNGLGFKENTLADTQGFGHELISECALRLTNSTVHIEGEDGFMFTLTFKLEGNNDV